LTYTVEFLKTAEKELAALPKEAQRQIARKIDALRENPRPPGGKLLQDEERFYRLRVGDYRVIYSIEGKRLVILVIKIGHRKDVYRNP
jgi:mRNA interferase RelE/StbE